MENWKTSWKSRGKAWNVGKRFVKYSTNAIFVSWTKRRNFSRSQENTVSHKYFRDVSWYQRWFSCEWRLRNERGNSILMTCHYADLSSASDWASRKGSLLQPIRSTILIWLVTRHKHGISVGVPQLSFRGYVGCILRRVKVDYWLIICRQGKKRDGCCCCIKLRDDYTESECGKRDLLQEIMDKYFGRVLLSLPGKVIAFIWSN